MDALQALLRPVAKLLNKNIQASTPAAELCEELEGTIVAVRVRNSALAGFFRVFDHKLEVSTEIDDDPDILIEGSLLTLARMSGDAGRDAIRDGTLELTGDAAVASRFQRLLTLARPDLEEELSSVVGDVAAHRVGQVLRGISRWGRDARSTMGMNIREYLQEESRDAPSRYEIERFGTQVGTLRDDVERLQARITRLQDRG